MKNVSTLCVLMFIASTLLAQVPQTIKNLEKANEHSEKDSPVYAANFSDSIIKIPGSNVANLLANIKLQDEPMKNLGYGSKTTNQQILVAPQGWSGLSSFIVPDNPDIVNLFLPIQDNLIILYNLQGTYLPSQGVNTLVNWDSQSGYVAKFNQETDIELSGQIVENGMLSLNSGWNLIPVLSTCPVSVETFFANQDVTVVREVAGWKLFWPEMGINTLDSLTPGKAYFVKMNSPSELTFPTCENLPPDIPSSPSPEIGSINQPLSITLSWLCTDPENNPLTFDLYFGTTNPPELIQSGITGFSYSVSQLQPSSTYFWKIIAHDDHGNTTEGPVWNFITEPGAWQCGNPVVDTRDSKTYTTVQIGTQCWMAQNLNVGTMINGTSNALNNGTIEKYCYSNTEANCDTYGGLYQWSEMMNYSTTPGVQGICLTGWHLPTDDEWTALTAYVSSQPAWLCNSNSSYIAKSLAATTNWNTSTTICAVGNNLSANNATGFTALPGGYRNLAGNFNVLGLSGYFWSSTQLDASNAWDRSLSNSFAKVFKAYQTKTHGNSVRCLKDNVRTEVD